MADGSIVANLTSAKSLELKDEVVKLLESCDGHRMDISSFKKRYKDFYDKKFLHQYPSLKNRKLRDVMKDLADVVTLEENRSCFTLVLNPQDGSLGPTKKKDSGPPKNQEKGKSRSRSQLVDRNNKHSQESQEPTSPPLCSSRETSVPDSNAKSSAVAAASTTAGGAKGAAISSRLQPLPTPLLPLSPSSHLKAASTPVSKSVPSGAKAAIANSSPLLPLPTPLLPLSPSLHLTASTPVLKSVPSGAKAANPSPLLQLPTPLLPLSPSLHLTGVDPPQPANIALPSLAEIMRQQEQEEKLANETCLPLNGYEKLLNEMQATPSPGKKVRGNSTPDQLSLGARAREIGTPGPMEKSFEQAQKIMSSVQSSPSKRVSSTEINTAAKNIIESLSDSGQFVSLEKVKAKLCNHFGRSSWSAFGIKRDKDIAALNDLIQLQNKVSLFIHAYVMCNSIATVHELGQSLADLESKQDFEDLKLGPLLQQPVVFDMFKAPPSLGSVPPITTIQILRHLERYMTREDLWREKVALSKFMAYLCEENDCETPYELGVRIQSVGLAISVIKKAKRSDSERWKSVREHVAADLDEEIQRHLKKIKKDLLGQEVGDLRSCAMKVIGASPVDALNEIFDCCLDVFEGKRQKKITNFFATITGDALGRRLFQLALTASCKRLVGDTLDSLVEQKVEEQFANRMKDLQETAEIRPLPPSEGELVNEVKTWLANADNIGLGRLAIIEATVLSKFPDFDSFEGLGNGSFLKFLTSHKELLHAIEEVGGLAMARSGGQRTRLGHQVSLVSILDFISQCGTQTSLEVIQQHLCNYYSIGKVTDLGYGSCSNLLKKASDRREKMTRTNTPAIVYEAALLCHDACAKNIGNSNVEAHKGSILGYMSKEDAIAAIQRVPLLEDVTLWTHWDEVFGGEVSQLGDLKSFLENEGILANAGKSTSRGHGSLVVMETSPGVLLRVTTNTSPEIFNGCLSRGDAVGAAGHLVSMVMLNGGVFNTPLALLANHVQTSLASMATPEGSKRPSDFVLKCLVRMPRKLAQTVGTKVFLEPLKKLIGSTEAPSVLLSCCSTQHQRSRLHRLGFVLGINQWIEDFHSRVRSDYPEEGSVLKIGLDEEYQKRPIAVVNPVLSRREKTERAERSVGTPEDDITIPLYEGHAPKGDCDDEEEDRNEVKDEEEAVSDAGDYSSEQAAFTSKQQEECRAVIEQIRREEFGIGLELGEEESKLVQRQREREGRGLHRLSTELYSRDTHFVLELVQNADDNSYPDEGSVAGFPSLVFVLESDKIVVFNNEIGFMEKNIRALCDVGKSTKGAHRYGYIGQKGIGFKSVFRVSDCPEVHSNGYRVRFDAKSGPIGYILPQWIEEGDMEDQTIGDELDCVKEGNKHEKQVDALGSEYKTWSTRIVLPLKEEHRGTEKSSLAARFRDVHPSLLLFLHRLRAIHIFDKENNTRRQMIRRDLGDNIMEVSHTQGKDRWLVIKKELDASNIQTKENVETTELALAFPLFGDADQEPTLDKRRQTLPQQNVFAYLPLRSYGFRFIIQGDFEVPSSREDVDSDKSWNQWLREEIPQLFVEAMSVFMDHPSVSGLSSVASYFQFVPLEEEILDFFTPVARHILTLLQGKPCVPVQTSKQDASSYTWVLPSRAIFCQDSTTQDLVTPALLKEHLGLCYLHSGIAKALNPTLRSRLGIETLSSKHLLEIAKEEVKKLSAKTSASTSNDDERIADVAKVGWLARWLQCMYRCLDQERNSSQETLDSIASLCVIPLTDGTFVNLKGDSVFLPLSMDQSSAGTIQKKKKTSSSEKTCLNILETDLSTVHPSLFSSLDDIGRSQVEQLLKRLGVKTWNAKDLVNSHIIPTFKSGKWKVKSPKVLRSYVTYILEQRLSDLSVCDVNELRSCVQILTNKGPLNPAETPIHFTARFGNAIDLAKQLPSISWTLVDESYLDAGTGSKARAADWKAFLAELGVQTFLSIKKKRVELHRSNMAESPWASYNGIWQTTPDSLYYVDDWSCEEFEEFLNKVCPPNTPQQIGPEESTLLAQFIDERWDTDYAQYADNSVQVKDSNDHVLCEAKSSFFLNLFSRPWMSARGEAKRLYIPKDLFIWSELLHKLLEDHVKYAAAYLKNESFKSILHIRESINVDVLLSEMMRWSQCAQSGESAEKGPSQEFTTSVSHMSEVYSFLSWRMSESEHDKRQITEVFRKNALIFVPRLEGVSKEIHMKNRVTGSFCLKKDVCWRDPTGIASKYLENHGKVITRRLLQGYYDSRPSTQQSLLQFFVHQLKVDDTPNVDEYVEMASTVAEVSRFPTRSSLDDMLEIFSVLGGKCISQGHSDNSYLEDAVDETMANFVRGALKKDDVIIFPSSDKWISLSDKPLLADEKSLLRIFQNSERGGREETKKGVYFLDLGELLQPRQQRSSKTLRKAKDQRVEELKKERVLLFLKICEVKTLSECVRTEFTPSLVEYGCVPLQRYFYNLMPHVQRFLYSKNPDVYYELNNQEFAQKLLQMQFNSVKSLETVYSLSTHPDILIPIEEKFGVQTMDSSFYLYVVKNCLQDADVLNAGMVKLLLGEKRQGSSELLNFLAAVSTYNGSDLEFFLEEKQNLDPLPNDEEVWCVRPPPEESVVPEPEEETPTEINPASATETTMVRQSGDDELHSWPPKSAAQYDKTRIPEGGSADSSVLKMWPPPAPPDSLKTNQENQVQGRTRQPIFGTEGFHGNENIAKEREDKVHEGVQGQHKPPRLSEVVEASTPENMSNGPNEMIPESSLQDGPDSSLSEEVVEANLPQDCLSYGVENAPQDMLLTRPDLSPVHGNVSINAGNEFQASQVLPSRAYLFFENGETDLDFEDLEFNGGDMKVFSPVEGSNREDVGRWGERCVYEYLLKQAQLLSPGEVEIVWINEKGNTIVPYDLEIRRRVPGSEKPVITYIEVKTTSSDQKDVFEISVQELQFAMAKQQAFHLYRVTLIPDRLRIRRLKNLAYQLEKNNVKLCLVI
ncbi:uncharacterized protein [Montipora capricornis]|uniref:uncharacterized protein isoform X2 n=1 Tax=Montipora capricornis TaxID=246305 RepID=UPI0035F1590F